MQRVSTVRWATLALVIVGSVACAPDAFQNVKATGFNDYLSTVETRCQPLWVGSMLLQRFDADYAGGRQSDFVSLLDATSRLYYNRSTPSQFREAVQSVAMSATDARTNRSIDCMIAQLPPNRPSSPSGGL